MHRFFFLLLIAAAIGCGQAPAKKKAAPKSALSNSPALAEPIPGTRKLPAYDADEIVNAFAANGVQAKASFSGKRILITGNVLSIDEDIASTPFLLLKSGSLGSSVKLDFPKSQSEFLSKVSRGDEIKVEATFSVHINPLVIVFNDCRLLKYGSRRIQYGTAKVD